MVNGVAYLRSRCFSAASTRRKFRMDASCGLSPSACSLGILSELISELMVEVDGIADSVSMMCIKRGCYTHRRNILKPRI